MPRLLLLLLAVMLIPATAPAQWVSMIGEDASVPVPGTVRLGVTGRVTQFDRRYSRIGDGTLEPLSADFGVGSFEAEQLPGEFVNQSDVRLLAGIPDLTLTLGNLDVRLTGRVEQVPVTLELGVLRRFALAVTVPWVRTRTTTAIGPGLGTDANAGLNPARTFAGALAQNTALLSAFAQASAELRGRLQQCEGSSDPSCASVNSDRAAAEAFAASAESFRGSLENVYVASAIVPITATPADQAIAARIAAFRSQFESYGVMRLSGAPARPVGAGPISMDDLELLVTDQEFGILADPLVTVTRISIGDVEVGGRLLLLDAIDPAGNRGFGLRFATGALVRLGTSTQPLTRNLVAINTGDGQTDIEAQAVLDAVFGRRFAATVSARYTRQLEDEPTLRIPDFPGQPIVLASRTLKIGRDLGDVVQIEATPRLAFTEFFSIGGYYSFRSKGMDRHQLLDTSLPDIDSPISPVDPGVLDVATRFKEHRAGFGIAFSNLAAHARGPTRYPFELSYLHLETTRASEGMVPKAREDRMQLRIYAPVWGRRNR